MTTAATDLPHVRINGRGARRLREGHGWIFRADVVETPQLPAHGCPVAVEDMRGAPLMVALWAPVGALALRRWGPPGSPATTTELQQRILHAVELRDRLLPGVHALRLCHGEADRLPGLFVDRYQDAVVLQTACSAMEAWLAPAVEVLREHLKPRLILRRDDGSARDMESLPRIKEVLAGGPSTLTTYDERGVLFEVDLLLGHKTGSYLDQRDNHALAGKLARGRCLDLFSCVGGFGLHMATRGTHVVCVEQDPVNLTRLRRNAELNQSLERVEVREANAFDVARSLHDARTRFDTVVLDPPALAKRAGPLEGALRGYFELNRRALQLCAPGGTMLTFSCSGRVTMDVLTGVVVDAAAQSHRQVQLLQRLHAGPDHPGLLGLPEAEYLKGLLLRVT